MQKRWAATRVGRSRYVGQRMTSDVAYYERRIREEHEAAKGALSPKARQCHLELAEAYQCRLRQIAAEDRRSAMRLVRAA